MYGNSKSFEICFVMCCVFLAQALFQQSQVHPRFSTKSSYNLSRELDILDGFYNHQNSTPPPQCLKDSVIHVTGIFRHGTRYPSLKDVKYARSLLEKLKEASMDPQLYNKLNDILNKFPNDDNKDIAPSGIVEHVHLGHRFGSKYLKLFASASEKDVEFYATSKNRTVDSFRGFLKGFQDASDYKFSPPAQIRDDLLRFYDYCDKYIDGVDKNESADLEAKLFINMNMNKLTSLIESSTNTKNLNITVNEVDALLDIAGCEDAIFSTRHWLEIMSEETLGILNYAADLEDYWKKGPGFTISYEQSCILVSEIFETFDKVIAGDRLKKGTYYFSHAETLYPVFSLLGVFMDHPPLYHNNSGQHRNRTFKSTRINPFASNVAFVLHECSKEIFIELLFKEYPITWSICGNNICPYKQVRSHLARYVDSCNFQEMCEEGNYRNVEL